MVRGRGIVTRVDTSAPPLQPQSFAQTKPPLEPLKGPAAGSN